MTRLVDPLVYRRLSDFDPQHRSALCIVANLSIQEVEAESSIKDQPWLHGEVGAYSDYMRPCVRSERKNIFKKHSKAMRDYLFTCSTNTFQTGIVSLSILYKGFRGTPA